jgi:hypothetical protein
MTNPEKIAALLTTRRPDALCDQCVADLLELGGRRFGAKKAHYNPNIAQQNAKAFQGPQFTRTLGTCHQCSIHRTVTRANEPYPQASPDGGTGRAERPALSTLRLTSPVPPALEAAPAAPGPTSALRSARPVSPPQPPALQVAPAAPGPTSALRSARPVSPPQPPDHRGGPRLRRGPTSRRRGAWGARSRPPMSRF